MSVAHQPDAALAAGPKDWRCAPYPTMRPLGECVVLAKKVFGALSPVPPPPLAHGHAGLGEEKTLERKGGPPAAETGDGSKRHVGLREESLDLLQTNMADLVEDGASHRLPEAEVEETARTRRRCNHVLRRKPVAGLASDALDRRQNVRVAPPCPTRRRAPIWSPPPI